MRQRNEHPVEAGDGQREPLDVHELEPRAVHERDDEDEHWQPVPTLAALQLEFDLSTARKEVARGWISG